MAAAARQTAASAALAPPPSPALTPPPGNPRFPLFDGLRALAALGVLTFHVFETTARLGVGAAGKIAEVAGSAGVIVFFGISGFLLYRPYVAARARGRAGPRTTRYARRRALRILPAYWTVLTLLALFPGIIGVFSDDWWRYYGYLQVYSNATVTRGIPVAWTLCVEVSFYIALPVWAWAVRRIPTGRSTRSLLAAELAPLATVAASGALVQLAAARHHVSHLVGITLAGQCTWLALGMMLAVLSVASERDMRAPACFRRLPARSELCWAGAAAAFAGLVVLVPAGGLFGLIATIETPQPLLQSIVKLTLQAGLVVLLLLPAVFGTPGRGLPGRVLAWAPIVWLGVISYSFYLWHVAVVQFLALDHAPAFFSSRGLNLLGHVHVAPTLVLFLVSFAVTGLLSTISYRLVELPFLRRKEG